jgi:transcriptional regulator with XRE-family HTH domain
MAKKTFSKELAETVGANTREARKALGLTQQQVADALGVTINFYARIERGKTLPSVSTLLTMTQVLHLSADRLLEMVPSDIRMADLSPEVAYLAGIARQDPALQRMLSALVAALEDTD